MEESVLSLIRKYSNDNIEPYEFSDNEINTIYSLKSSNLYLTVSEIWLQKAILTKSNISIKSYSIGNESYNYDKSTYDSFMEMYNFFIKKANSESSSIYEGDANTEENDEYAYNELMGGKYDAEY